MFRILFLLFLLVPAIELYVLIKVGGVIGALPTILLTVFTAVLGAYLMRSQGVATMQRAQQSLLMGQPPQVEVIEGVMIFVGGVLLLIPGLVTDFIGFMFLIPPIRQAIVRSLLKSRGQPSTYTYDGYAEPVESTTTKQQAKIEIIEAEWVEVESDKKK